MPKRNEHEWQSETMAAKFRGLTVQKLRNGGLEVSLSIGEVRVAESISKNEVDDLLDFINEVI